MRKCIRVSVTDPSASSISSGSGLRPLESSDEAEDNNDVGESMGDNATDVDSAGEKVEKAERMRDRERMKSRWDSLVGGGRRWAVVVVIGRRRTTDISNL